MLTYHWCEVNLAQAPLENFLAASTKAKHMPIQWPTHSTANHTPTEMGTLGPGWVAQLVRASSRYAKVAGLIPRQGRYKNQPVNTLISGTPSQCFSLSKNQSIKIAVKRMSKQVHQRQVQECSQQPSSWSPQTRTQPKWLWVGARRDTLRCILTITKYYSAMEKTKLSPQAVCTGESHRHNFQWKEQMSRYRTLPFMSSSMTGKMNLWFPLMGWGYSTSRFGWWSQGEHHVWLPTEVYPRVHHVSKLFKRGK